MNHNRRAFDSLKKALTVQVQPILKMADLSKPFTLQVDASNEGLGAVLLQDEEGKKSPIAYASRKLKPSEIICSNRERMSCASMGSTKVP